MKLGISIFAAGAIITSTLLAYNEQQTSPTTQVSLTHGWNIVSIPYSNVTPEGIAASATSNSIGVIWKYDTSSSTPSWKWYSNINANKQIIAGSATATPTLTNLDAGDAVWILSSPSTQSINLTGNAPSDLTLQLKSGWQLVGAKDGSSVGSNAFNKSSLVDLVWRWNSSSGGWQVFSPDSGTLQQIEDIGLPILTPMNANEGFWVKAKIPGKLFQTNQDIASIMATTKLATVANAKTMVENLRTTLFSVYSDDSTKLGTISAQQSTIIQDKINPAANQFSKDISDMLSTTRTSFDNFSADLSNLTMQTTFENIENRANAWNSVIETNKASLSWGPTVTEFGDSISLSGGVLTITNSSNSTNISGSFSIDTNGHYKVSNITSGAFKGTNYDIAISSLTHDITTGLVAISATGTIGDTDSNNVSSVGIKATNMDISLGFSPNIVPLATSLKNMSIHIVGEAYAKGRKATGTITLNDSSKTGNTIIGTFAGLNTEPSVSGTITSSVDLEKARASNADEFWGELFFIQKTDGTKQLVVSYQENISTSGTTYTYTTLKPDGTTEDFDCSSYPYNSSTTNSCTNGTLLAVSPYSQNYNYMSYNPITVSIFINGEQKIVQSANFKYNYEESGSSYPLVIYSENGSYIYNNSKMYYGYKSYTNTNYENGYYSVMPSSVEVTISNVSYQTKPDAKKLVATYSFSGSITQGSKSITATATASYNSTRGQWTYSLLNPLVVSGSNSLGAYKLSVTTQDSFINSSNNYMMEFMQESSNNIKDIAIENANLYISVPTTEVASKPLSVNGNFSYHRICQKNTTCISPYIDKLNIWQPLEISTNARHLIQFDGGYTYDGSSFNGSGSLYLTEIGNVTTTMLSMPYYPYYTSYTTNGPQINGNIKLKGKVIAKSSDTAISFPPFNIDIQAGRDQNGITGSGKILFEILKTDGTVDYTLAGTSTTSSTDITTINLADSNGVLVNFSTPIETFNVTNQNNEPLGTYNKNINKWEIKFSDGDSKSLY